MGPASRYVVRSTGCGRFLGLILIVIAVIILLANSGLGVSWNYRRWWPILIVAFGFYLLLRSYWLRFSNRSKISNVIDVGALPRLSNRKEWWRPPGLPVVIMAIGAIWLVVNLTGAQRWVIWVIVLVAAGLLLLGGSLRASVSRT